MKDHLLGVDIIPYHSNSISLPQNLDCSQIEYLKTQFYMYLDFAKDVNVSLRILNGKIFENFLLKKYYLRSCTISTPIINPKNKYQISRQLTVYFFVINKISIVLFNSFLTGRYAHLTNEELGNNIPRILKDQFAISL